MKIGIGVFFGGKTVEHEVSIISAMQTMAAIDKKKFRIVPIYIAKNGYLFTGELLTDIENFKDIDKLLNKCERCIIVQDANQAIVQRANKALFKKNVIDVIDVAFPVMHGTFGEDGSLQGFFELLGIPYVGSNVVASAVGMDKIFFKKILKEEGLPVTNYLWVYSSEIQSNMESVVASILDSFCLPLVIKPANLGSSIGISAASNKSELEASLDIASAFAQKVIIEPKVQNLKEVNCSVIGDHEFAAASVCEEPVKSEEILSYKDKYQSGNKSKGMDSLKRIIPADIPIEMSELIKEMAIKTFVTIGCAGVARIDFLIDSINNKIYVNEINTIPGSLSFYLWEASKINFTELTSKLIDGALKRHRENNKITYSIDVNLLALNSKSGSKL